MNIFKSSIKIKLDVDWIDFSTVGRNRRKPGEATFKARIFWEIFKRTLKLPVLEIEGNCGKYRDQNFVYPKKSELEKTKKIYPLYNKRPSGPSHTCLLYLDISQPHLPYPLCSNCLLFLIWAFVKQFLKSICSQSQKVGRKKRAQQLI